MLQNDGYYLQWFGYYSIAPILVNEVNSFFNILIPVIIL